MRCSYLLAFALAAAGCTKGICSRSSDCATGLVCTAQGICEVPADASTDDGGGADGAADARSTPIGDAFVEDAEGEPRPDGDEP